MYLLDEGGLSIRTKPDSSPMYVDLYGGVMKKRPILGIPINMKTSVTDYSQAKDILSSLSDSGVDEMVVSYKNWTSDGIKNKVDTGASPSWTLGGKKGFGRLTDYISGGITAKFITSTILLLYEHSCKDIRKFLPHSQL